MCRTLWCFCKRASGCNSRRIKTAFEKPMVCAASRPSVFCACPALRKGDKICNPCLPFSEGRCPRGATPQSAKADSSPLTRGAKTSALQAAHFPMIQGGRLIAAPTTLHNQHAPSKKIPSSEPEVPPTSGGLSIHPKQKKSRPARSAERGPGALPLVVRGC